MFIYAIRKCRTNARNLAYLSGKYSSCISANCLSMEGLMTAKEAIRILMLSPIYFQIPPIERIELIKDYCELYNQDHKKKQ
jgi:hypothetical protein